MGFRSVPIIQSRELCDVAKNARHKLRDKSLVFLCLLLIFGTKKRCASHEEVFFRLCFSNFQITLERNSKLLVFTPQVFYDSLDTRKLAKKCLKICKKSHLNFRA